MDAGVAAATVAVTCGNNGAAAGNTAEECKAVDAAVVGATVATSVSSAAAATSNETAIIQEMMICMWVRIVGDVGLGRPTSKLG